MVGLTAAGVSGIIHTHNNAKENNMEWTMIIVILAILLDG